MMEFLIMLSVTMLWAALHSWLASNKAKAWAKRRFGMVAERGYRLAYNVVSAVTLAPIALLMHTLPDHTLYAAKAPWSAVLLAAQAISGLLAALAVVQTGLLHFAGLAQVVGERSASGLTRTGLYALVRHPIYLFGLLFLWLSPSMSANQLALWIALSIYFFVGATLEEKRLVGEF
ncbi:MAG TPA: hypothetical protein VIU38_12300, partial [Anaerolineales bacterium]